MAVQGKNNDFFIISIRHTGTRFLTRVLDCNHDHVDRVTVADDVIVSMYFHPSRNQTDCLGAYPPYVLVSPLRDPRKVWRSWAVRGATTSIVSHGPATVQDCFIDSWKKLAKLEDIFYVPIDRPEREDQLRLLERKVNKGLPLFHPVRELNADWSKRVGHVSYPSELPYDDWYDEFDFIYDLPMIKPYYKR